MSTYNKLEREKPISPLPATSISDDPAYSQPDLSAIQASKLLAVCNPEYDDEEDDKLSDEVYDEYDEIPSTLKREYGDKQPAPPASSDDYYNDIASDVVPKPSHQCIPHSFSKDTPASYGNVILNEPSESSTGEENFKKSETL